MEQFGSAARRIEHLLRSALSFALKRLARKMRRAEACLALCEQSSEMPDGNFQTDYYASL
jgi:hypothetical protein